MMPGPLTYWLEQLVIIIALTACILLLPLLPARHFISHYWPGLIEELIVEGPDGPDRLLLPVGYELATELTLVARSRPRSLVTVEMLDGELVHGFPIGIRRPDADGLEYASRMEQLLSEGRLVLQLADESALEIDSDLVRRVYRTNQLSLLDRVHTTVMRMIESGDSKSADMIDIVVPEQRD